MKTQSEPVLKSGSVMRFVAKASPDSRIANIAREKARRISFTTSAVDWRSNVREKAGPSRRFFGGIIFGSRYSARGSPTAEGKVTNSYALSVRE